MKNTNTTVNTWIFNAESVTVNGQTFPAKYSVTPKGDVFIFPDLRAINHPAVRVHITQDMPMYGDAFAAAQAEKLTRQAAKAEPAPAVEAAAPVADPAPVQDAPAPVTEPAPAKKATRKKAAKKAEPAPVVEAAAPVAEPVPVQASSAPAKNAAAPVEKPWIGSSISGKGWAISFDAAAGRTRVTVEGTPTDAQRVAIEQAGFYWSPKMSSWNKGLTCKAYRAAQALAAALAAIA